MRQLPKKLTALLAAAALCLAAPVGALADGPSVLYTFAEEYQAALSEPLEITTFDDDGTAAAATVTTTGDSTEVTEEGYYTVTIPATVSVSDASKAETFALSGKLQPYRKLTIDVSTANYANNSDHLKCGSATLPYTLSASSSDSSLTITNDKSYTATTDSTAQDFSADLSVQLADGADPSVSGEYTDTLTFTMACEKVTKAYTTVNVTREGMTGTTSGSYDLTPGEKLTLEDLYNLGIVGHQEGDNDGRWKYRWKEPDVTVPEDPNETFEIKLERKQVYLNLNSLYYNPETRMYEKSTNLLNNHGGEGGKVMATVEIWVNDEQVTTKNTNGTISTDHVDIANTFAYGSSYEFKNIKVASGYKLVGYFVNTETDDELEDKMKSSSIEDIRNKFTNYTDVNNQDITALEISGKLTGCVSYTSAGQLIQTLYLVFEPTITTSDTGTTAEQSLTITDTMRDYFAAIETGDDPATDSPAEDAEDAEDADTTAETPETAPEDGYDSDDDDVVDEYPVVFFETE